MEAPAVAAGRVRRVRLMAIGASLLVAVLAFTVLRVMDSPWTGHTGQEIFGKGAKASGAWERYSEVIRCYTDSKHPARADFELRDWISTGLWVGSAFALVVALLGAMSAWWWGRWICRPAGPEPVVVAGARIPRWSWVVLAIAMVAGSLLRLQTIHNAPFWDEQDNMRRNFHGYLDWKKPDMPPKWKPAGWDAAIWENERGNNPYFYSLVSQVSMRTWRAWTGEPEEKFSVVAMRMPSVVLGVLAIAALWWSMNRMGFWRTAPWAALLLAVHGLAIEFAVEARGHGMNLFFSALTPGLVWAILERGRARSWVAYALVQIGALWSYPGALFHVAGVNLFLAAVLLWRWWRGGDAWGRCGLARWGVANTAAVVACVWLMAPAAPQAALYYATKFPTGHMGMTWQVGMFLSYASGLCPLFEDAVYELDWQGQPALAWMFTGFWKFAPLAAWTLVAFPLLFGAGLRAIWVTSGGRLRLGVLAVSVVMAESMVLAQSFTGMFMYFWYVIFMLPSVLIITAEGIGGAGGWLAARFRKPSWANRIAGGLATGAVGWLVLVTGMLVWQWSWKDEIVLIHRKPVVNPWQTGAGLIPRFEIMRGTGNWVTYADGYHVVLRDYEGDDQAWAGALNRTMDQWGKRPGPPVPVNAQQ